MKLTGLTLVGLSAAMVLVTVASAQNQKTSPFHDYKGDKPGAVHRITLADLPPPFATESAQNGPKLVPRPEGALP